MKISELEKSWNQLAKLAGAHLDEGARFRKLCIEYYGIYWQSLPQLADDDAIIDTIDYGNAALSFENFHKKVQAAIREKEKNRKW